MGGELGRLWALGSMPRRSMRHRSSILAPAPVARYFPRHRRRRSPQPPSNTPQRLARSQPPRDPLPLRERQPHALTFEEIGDIVGRSPAACRQLASRARRIQADPEAPRTAVDRGELEEVARRFADACAAGTIEPSL